MGRRLAAACVGALLATQAMAGEWMLASDGYGPFRIGMRFEQAQAAMPGLKPTPAGLRGSPGCDYLELPGHPGVALMFVDGVLGRVDIDKPGERTTRGVAPGDPVSSFEKAYPDAKRTPNAYDDRERYLTVGPRHGRAMRAETQEGRIVAIYAGNWTQVQYVEGCL
jgi:hypothetical protein